MTVDETDAETFKRRIDGTTEAVRGHLRAIETLARDTNLEPEVYADVLIVLGEVLNNIVEHAFSETDQGWIDCTVSRLSDRFAIETYDNGTPLPPKLLSAGELPDIGPEVADLPEGGFGWFIVHALTDDMMYERDGGRNRLSFSLQIP